jgi:hypothetical protein
VHINFANFDAQRNVIVTEVDPSADKAVMRVERRSKLKLRFDRECQTFRIGNLVTLPEVEINPALPARQVIVTPLCDGDRNLIGYEYRYGSQADGCNAKATLREYRQCKVVKVPPSGQQGELTIKQRLCIHFAICD